jgi:hypothetical protein
MLCVFCAARTPAPLRAWEQLKLTSAQGNEENAVELLFDARITPRVLDESWGHAGGRDGTDNIDSDFTKAGYAPTEIAVVTKNERVISHLPLTNGRSDEIRRLARLRRITLSGRSLFMVTVDYSEAAGSFSGDAVEFYEVKNDKLSRLETTLPDGTQKRGLSLMNSLKSGWKLSPDENNPSEIREIQTLFVGDEGKPAELSGDFENVLTRVTLKNERWVRYEKHVCPPAFFDIEDPDEAFHSKFFNKARVESPVGDQNQ